MKRYRDPDSGQIQSVADDAKEKIAQLEKSGWVLWDDAAIKAKVAAGEKAKQAAADQLAAAQKEMAERNPERLPYFSGEEVVAEGVVEPVDANKPPKPGTVVAQGTIEPQPPQPGMASGPPQAPAVPKKK